MKANCYECKFRGNVAGDAHSCCNYPENDTGVLSFFERKNFENMKNLNIVGDIVGILSQKQSSERETKYTRKT